ncbi:unnamed protein product, partial [Tenebrio molitor]
MVGLPFMYLIPLFISPLSCMACSFIHFFRLFNVGYDNVFTSLASFLNLVY